MSRLHARMIEHGVVFAAGDKGEVGHIAIGVDLGIKTLATLSDGKAFASPRALQHARKRLRRLERQKSRRKLGGKNRKRPARNWPNSMPELPPSARMLRTNSVPTSAKTTPW